MFLERHLTPPGIAAFNIILTSVVMFCIHFFETSLFYSIPIITTLIYIIKPMSVTHILYGHWSFLRLTTLQWGILPCMLFYVVSAFPYIFIKTRLAHTYPLLPVEQFVGLLIAEGVLYYAATRHGKTSLYGVLLLVCSYAHNGPYGWIIHMEEHNAGRCLLFGFLEMMLPSLVVILLTATLGTRAERPQEEKKIK